ncbi:MAG: cell division protein, partial [Bacteroidia bacterium]|nr:cell division protein [Bacteroidia bacterium]
MSDKKKDILLRVYFVYFFLCLFGLAIIAQIINVQFNQGKYWRDKAEKLTYDYKNIEAARGNIYAAGNELLSTSIPIYDIRMDLRADGLNANVFDENVDSLAYYLSYLFNDKSPNEYSLKLRRARAQGKRYFLIQSKVKYGELQKLKKFPIFRLGQYKGGLIIEQKSKREKPFKLLAERTIGYARTNVQPVGIEGAFDEQLKGRGGKRLMQRISGGVWRPVNDQNEIEPLPGSDVFTTIDLNIQDVAENALYTQLAKYKASKGCAIVMEVKTGEIKAIANLSRTEEGNYIEDYNYAIGFGTEPGSTFKLASV